jgi:predicted membrane protein
MQIRTPFRLSFQVALGLIVVLLGVLFTLDNLDLLYARDYLRYWPALLVLYGLWRAATCDTTSGKVWGLFWALVGSILLLDKLYIIDVRLWDLGPLILVVIGASMLFGTMRRHRQFAVGTGLRSADSNSTISAVAILGGFKRTNDSQDFRGGEATAIMGGCELDLRQASIKEGEAVLDLFAFWGGIEIRVPEDWTVVLEGVPVLGGFEDKTRAPKESHKRLIIKGYVVMGGAEIKN